MKYVSNSTFDGQRVSIGSAVLVCWEAREQPRHVETLEVALFPAVVEAISDEITFRLSDGRVVRSSDLNGYDLANQCRPLGGYISTTIETVTRLPLRTWTWPPRV